MLKAFGTFEGNLVLQDSVCAGCNAHFGETLDRFLSRDSAEAMLRFRHGLKDPQEVAAMFTSRVEVTVPADVPQWGGVHLRLVPPEDDRSEPVVDLVPQVGFARRDGTTWDYWTEDELKSSADFKSVHDEQYRGQRVILYDTDESRTRLLELLNQLHVPFKQDDEFRGFPPFRSGEITTRLDFTMDREIARAMARIGVNYMTCVCGSEFALRADFNEMRRFIRYGEGDADWRCFVEIRNDPILADDTRRWRQTDGHIVAVQWEQGLDGIIARVSPFNAWTYVVKLAARFDGVFRPISSGHVFDVRTRRVRKLNMTNRIIPVRIPLIVRPF